MISYRSVFRYFAWNRAKVRRIARSLSQLAMLLSLALMCISTPSLATTETTSNSYLGLGLLSLVRPQKPWSGYWSLSLGGRYEESGLDHVTATYLRASALVRYQLANHLKIQMQALAKANSSQAQYSLSEEPEDKISFQEFVVSYDLFPYTELQAGAVSQEYLETPILISESLAFPGARLSYSRLFRDWRFDYQIQKVIPTSQSTTADLSEQEGIPSLFTQKIKGTYNWNADTRVGFSWLGYQFDGLPSQVAFNSGLRGNTTNGQSYPATQFIDGFNGGVIALDAATALNDKLSLELGGFWIRNGSAPEKSNQGQQLHLASSYRIQSYRIRPSVTWFVVESDVTPAYYASGGFGHNDRYGQQWDLEVEFVELGFKLASSYVKSDLINPDSVRDDLEGFSVMLETLDVHF
ncbi:MAG: hypothetical protein H6626_02670 [Pseudobdellovibrionaceae bacterium]|nr:hypothetical protein [Bdellovibrionales bacterium]USN48010.1 MAG: hypothetical protein H6626_02670 [Pseudobdellovibrionaceae bacterium]